MADIRDIVDDFVNRMGVSTRDCKDTRFPGCWFLERGSTQMIIIPYESNKTRMLRFASPIMPIPKANQEGLFRRLLELNYEIAHGAFAVDGKDDYVIIVDTLQADHIDFDEFFATVESVLVMADLYDDALIAEFGNREDIDAST